MTDLTPKESHNAWLDHSYWVLVFRWATTIFGGVAVLGIVGIFGTLRGMDNGIVKLNEQNATIQITLAELKASTGKDHDRLTKMETTVNLVAAKVLKAMPTEDTIP